MIYSTALPHRHSQFEIDLTLSKSIRGFNSIEFGNMSPVEAIQVYRLFQTLNENKTSLDIPNKLIKIASEPLSVPLGFTYIYNQSIANGTVPDVFKISRVTPIYKSGEVSDTGNYRPATLSSFSKVLERLIYNQLY